MPTIVKSAPGDSSEKLPVKGTGRSLLHECADANGKSHRQRLPLGSVRGIFYLDAICLHCGAHFIWDDDVDSGEDSAPGA